MLKSGHLPLPVVASVGERVGAGLVAGGWGGGMMLMAGRERVHKG